MPFSSGAKVAAMRRNADKRTEPSGSPRLVLFLYMYTYDMQQGGQPVGKPQDQNEYEANYAGFSAEKAIEKLKKSLKEKEEKKMRNTLSALRFKLQKEHKLRMKEEILKELSTLVSPVLLKLVSDLCTEELQSLLLDPEADPDTKTILQAILDTKEK